MQRAGAAAARQIAQRLGTPKTVAIVCGPGNNGGDGYVCALELAQRGHRVECAALSPPVTDDARAAAAAWRASGGTVRDGIDPAARYDAVVDAMFGIGLSRPLDRAFAAAASWINAQRAGSRIALDVPSGLDADRGSWVGAKPGVTADQTITFLGAKPGLFTGAGCDAAGEVLVESIGVELPGSQLTLTDRADFASICRPRARDSHKGDYGNVGVIGGGIGMVGAPLLAARAALRMGAGRVFVECIAAPAPQFDPLHPELMLRSVRALERLDAVVIGCGLGTDAGASAALEWALTAKCPAVFDADALNLLARDAALREALRRRGGTSVLTPHPLEAARLLQATAQEVQADRIGCARRLAHATTATVVLKGAGTVIALPDGRAWINPTGTPALATPGSGDVLGGMIGAMLAQPFMPLEATLAAVWLHGAAADRFDGDVGLVAGEIAARSAACLAQLRREPST
ncbi:MAG TPA: NAD(P)H-hydrate dehydratase [Burkholderiaceae bacterium]|nr:NAD(P)H-hydrate dehydratase [Burkholderiaceae bacterium]